MVSKRTGLMKRKAAGNGLADAAGNGRQALTPDRPQQECRAGGGFLSRRWRAVAAVRLRAGDRGGLRASARARLVTRLRRSGRCTDAVGARVCWRMRARARLAPGRSSRRVAAGDVVAAASLAALARSSAHFRRAAARPSRGWSGRSASRSRRPTCWSAGRDDGDGGAALAGAAGAADAVDIVVGMDAARRN